MKIIKVIGSYRQAGRSWFKRDVGDIKKITVHHTASRATGTDENILQSIMATHVNNGWPGLAYHFIILKNGNIYQINDFTEVTWHDTHNYDSIGVCLHGYFHKDYNETPTAEQLASLKWLLDRLCTEHPEFPADHDDVVGHRERSSTACPGDFLFPKVVEYRTKLGKVNWESPTVSPIDEATLRKLEILWDDGEGKRKEVEWYVKEWYIEKQSAVSLGKKFTESEGFRIIAERKLMEKNDLYEGLFSQVGIITNHVETIQNSFSEFGHNQSLMSSTIVTLKETINTLREALESLYKVWDETRQENDVKLRVLDESVRRQATEIESLTNSLRKQELINIKDIETIPDRTILKEFFKLIFNRR